MVEPLIIPKPIHEEPAGNNSSRFVIEPLYPGYGTTMGNALRRILLSSLPGCAVSAISIEGVQHEFSALKDVKEDVVDILLNIKQVRFRIVGEHDEPIKAEIDFHGTGAVKASEFSVPTGVECVSPDAPVATVTAPKGHFRLTAYLTRGRGFLSVESREKEKLEIGTIAMDAIYAPVRHVALSFDHVRVGQMTNYDKVMLVVETDGSLTPREAMAEAITILRAQAAGLALSDGGVSEGGVSVLTEQEAASVAHESPAPAEPTAGVAEEPGEDAPAKKRGRKKKAE